VEGVDAELARVLVEDARVALEAPARAPAARDAKEGAVTACIVSQLLWLVRGVVTSRTRTRFVADVTRAVCERWNSRRRFAEITRCLISRRAAFRSRGARAE
jgi:hypothetical protein